MKLILWWLILTLRLSFCWTSDNLALGKPAYQTGILQGPGAGGAVDGKLWEGNVYNCAITDAPTNTPAQWWVDLQDDYLVQDVIIHSTGDIFDERLTYLEISVGSSADPADLTPCAYNAENVTQGGSVTIYCNGVGRFVHIERTYGETINIMALCEVQVFGRKFINLENLARSKNTNQSGTFSDSHKSPKAVDGSLGTVHTNCAVPKAANNQPAWWWVDLGSTYVITDVIINSRGDFQVAMWLWDSAIAM